MRLSGSGGKEFLHGQTTADFNDSGPGDLRYAAFCNPKGRVLADVLAVIIDEQEILLRGRTTVMAALAEGRDMLFDIDWQGTQQLADASREDLVSVFILPPSTRDLEQRLLKRAQDSAHVVAARMSKAADEISHYREYDYILVNRDIDVAVEQVKAILQAERLRRDRQVGLTGFVKTLRAGY